MRFPFRPLLKPAFLAAIVACLVAGVQAQGPGAPPPAPVAGVAPASPPVPLLWRVVDGDNTVYLLGSFHLLEAGDYPLSRDVDQAFADAESVMFELPPEEMSSPQLGMQMGQAALRGDGTRLDDQLPPDTARKLAAWATANAVDPEGLQKFEPWFVGLMVTLTQLTSLGLDPKLGLDAHMARAAASAGKPTAGFETGAEQVAFLDGMGDEEQLQFIAEALEQAGEGDAEMRMLHAAWRRGDATAMWNEMAVEMRDRYPDLYRRINVERNDRWLPAIERRLRVPGGDDTLVVVGALHLLGEDGVVGKLRARGYEVERICSACAASAMDTPR